MTGKHVAPDTIFNRNREAIAHEILLWSNIRATGEVYGHPYWTLLHGKDGLPE